MNRKSKFAQSIGTFTDENQKSIFNLIEDFAEPKKTYSDRDWLNKNR